VKTTTLLRISSILSLLFWAGHTLGRPWTPAKAADAQAVVQSMKALSFDAMGSSRSYWDFYYGFGVSISVYMLAQALVLWLMASMARTDAARLRPLIAVFALTHIVNAFIVGKYFFILPLIFSLVIALCLILTFASARRTVATESAAT